MRNVQKELTRMFLFESVNIPSPSNATPATVLQIVPAEGAPSTLAI